MHSRLGIRRGTVRAAAHPFLHLDDATLAAMRRSIAAQRWRLALVFPSDVGITAAPVSQIPAADEWPIE